MMPWPQIVSLCISCFSLGFCLCGFVFTSIQLWEPKRWRKDREISASVRPKKRPDIHKPLTRLPGESVEHFVQRVLEKMEDGDLTINAARASFGLPPIPKKPDEQEKSCLTCEYNENGVNRPCKKCKDFSKWTPEAKE